MAFSVPPGYRRKAPVKRPKLDAYTGIIDCWLEGDRGVHRKQHHTARRVFERLRDEHGFTGGYTIVKDYMRERERRGREMFVPLAHPPGHAQADFGEATVIIGGIEQKAHFFVMDLPHSDACSVRAYPAATAEAWVDGHVHAFAFFGKVPASILYDNDRCLVAKILPDGTRQRATLFEPGSCRTTCSATATAAPAREKLIRQVGETRFLSSTKPSNILGSGISAGFSASHTSAMLPGNVPCAVSAHSSLQRSSSQMFSASRAGTAGMSCHMLWRASRTFFST